MRRSSVWTRGSLALGLAAGCWAFAQRGAADGPKASWTATWWPWSSKKAPEAKKDGDGESVINVRTQVDAARRLRAELDWKRRAEVCQKLRQIAYETKDEELDRQAERLDQRAWDAYVRQLGVGAVPVERIGVDFNQVEHGSTTLPKAREGQR
jgi:hypothetical protein